MRLVERKNIDVVKWDNLVCSTKESSIFSLSYYLDAVAENWCVFVDETYTRGVALSYTVRLGVKCLYTPIFGRYSEIIGEVNCDELIKIIQENFTEANFAFKTRLTLENETQFVFQELNELKLNQQAKRMLQKFQKANFEIKEITTADELIPLLEKELSEKVEVFNSSKKSAIYDLVQQLNQNNLLKIDGIFQEDRLIGGMIFMRFNNRVVYLKGASSFESKSSGVMYQCMYNEISNSLQQHLLFDFGGSRIENVRRFNLNFGSQDVVYYNYQWSKAPIWFKWLKSIRNRLKK